MLLAFFCNNHNNMLFTLFDIVQMVGRGSDADGRRWRGGVLGDDGRLRLRLLLGVILFAHICKSLLRF